MLRQLLGGTDELQHDMSAAQKSLATPQMDVQWSPTSSSTLTGTPELFSSTFAMLSDSSLGPYAGDGWVEQPKPVPDTIYATNAATASGVFIPPANNIYNSYDARLDHPSASAGLHQMAPMQLAPPQQFPFRPQPHYFAPTGPSFHGAAPYPIYNHQIPGPAQPHFINNHRVPHDSARLHPTPGPMQPPPRPMPHQVAAQNGNAGANPRRPSTVSPSDQASLNSPTLTSSGGSATSDTPPLNGEGASTDMEELKSSEEERVMCVACKGIYPSRRSLTGHLGRAQSCREFVGRSYLDQIASGGKPIAPGTENAIKAGAITNGQDGLSPICPHCDRFISHYKGNIRRHINQCQKNGDNPKRRGDKDKKREYKRRKTEDDVSALKEGYDPVLPPPHSAPVVPRMARSLTDVMSSPPLLSPSASYSCDSSPGAHHLHHSMNNGQLQSPNSNSNGESPMKSNEPPDDAYICDGCEFVTIYKGNMKRHLNTCHPAPDCKDLKEWDRKLESMKASAQGITKNDLIEKLNAHKLNSTRGRKPRSRKGTKEESLDDIGGMNIQESEQSMQMDYAHHQPLYGYDHMGY
ncbi:hypothetical protein WR25_05361 isoform A [Diploscapter pachys]|uniref:C2H2-type domain-containing protein n=1 Tax=Diploscapter pachys TaxID=2018661 RepID=A0A2A2K9W2_9BILA|nr:hypothetical protein WR25_05361 isoform A [Diploscapter pachys]